MLNNNRKKVKSSHYIVLLRLIGLALISIIIVGCEVTTSDDDKEGWTPLHHAAEQGDVKKATQLIAEGADVNATDKKYTFTPLHYAGNKWIVRLLISKGAKVDAKGIGHITPLIQAADSGREDVAITLIERGANVNAKTTDGKTAIVVGSRNPLLVKTLIKKGADVNAGGSDTALLRSVSSGAVESARYLIKHGARTKLNDPQGITLLHRAASNATDNPKMVELILETGFNVNVQDKIGLTPLHYAVRESCESNVQYLISKGAKINIKDKQGRTPLGLAIKEQTAEGPDGKVLYADVIRILRKHGAK